MSLRTCCCGALVIAIAAIGAPATRALDGHKSSYAHIPPDAFSVVAQVQAKPGKEDELRAATLPLIGLVRSEPNNLVYFLQEDRDAPGHFAFYEVFVSEADFEAHNATPYVREFLAKLPELALGEVQVTKMRVLDQPAR